MIRRSVEALKAMGLAAGLMAVPHEAKADESVSKSTVETSPLLRAEIMPATPSTPEQIIIDATQGKRVSEISQAEKIPSLNAQVQGKKEKSETDPEGDIQVQIKLAENLALKLAAKAEGNVDKIDPQAALRVRF